MEKLYYSIGEVAGILGESSSLVRFWTNSFSKYLKPKRSGNGSRKYTADEVEFLRQLHYLIKDKGMTLEGAGRQIAEDRKSVESRVKALDSLRSIRAQLDEIRKTL